MGLGTKKRGNVLGERLYTNRKGRPFQHEDGMEAHKIWQNGEECQTAGRVKKRQDEKTCSGNSRRRFLWAGGRGREWPRKNPGILKI